MMAAVRPWLPALAWGALIFAVSSRPRLPVAFESGSDKVAHFIAYAVLGALLVRGQIATGVSSLVILLAGWLYAASDEWHQSFVPGRSAEAADWVADALGVAAAVFAFTWFRRRRAAAPRSESHPPRVQR